MARSHSESGFDFEPPSQRGVGFGVGSAKYGKEEQGTPRWNRLRQAAAAQRFAAEALQGDRVRRVAEQESLPPSHSFY
jgi:hypothetical protein